MSLSTSDKKWIKENTSTSAPAAPVKQPKCECKCPTSLTEAQVKAIVEATVSAQFAEINNKLNTLYTELQGLKAVPPTE